MIALFAGRPGAAKYLMQHGALASTKNKDGISCLLAAIHHQQTSVLQQMMERTEDDVDHRVVLSGNLSNALVRRSLLACFIACLQDGLGAWSWTSPMRMAIEQKDWHLVSQLITNVRLWSFAGLTRKPQQGADCLEFSPLSHRQGGLVLSAFEYIGHTEGGSGYILLRREPEYPLVLPSDREAISSQIDLGEIHGCTLLDSVICRSGQAHSS